jgi:biotin-[acetyl-CoA-carboxylase] ligase BirA-like protein
MRNDRWFIREFEEIDSTNLHAKRLLADGTANDGDVLHAWHQTAGRGREQGREWTDNLGESLLLTVILRELPSVYQDQLQFLIALTGLDTLREAVPALGSRIRLKWPNDLFIDHLKVGGVLVESVWEAQTWKGAVAGIGINLNQERFPAQLPNATSIFMATGEKVAIRIIRNNFLQKLEQALETPQEIIGRTRAELAWMRDYGPLEITLKSREELDEPVYEDITEAGALVVRDRTGKRHELLSADVTLGTPVI